MKRVLKDSLHQFWYVIACVVIGIVFPLRVSGTRRFPSAGGVLVIANHQSFLDPVLLGLAVARPACYVARKTLFWFAPFRWLIQALDAIPIDQEGVATEGIKETIARLEGGRPVIIFPEGSRTPDGKLGSLERGILLILRKTNVPIVVAGISGAFESWSIHQPLPIPGPLWIHFESWQPAEARPGAATLADLSAALERVVEHANQSRRRLVHTSWTASLVARRPVRR